MIRAVLDTNVYISSLFWKGAPHEVVKKGLGGAFLIIVSGPIMGEVREKLIDKFDFPLEHTYSFIEIIVVKFFFVEPNIKLSVVAADSADDKIIECAYVGKAHYVVTGDRHLLDIKEYGKIKIVTPREFLKIL